MQPCAAWVGITQIGERSKVVEVAGIHLAGVANNDHRPIDLSEQLGQRGNVHRSARCGCLAHLVTTKAECTLAFAGAEVDLCARNDMNRG
ncbi:MAG: hypothetical protein AW06_002223 [Candidatus Accumulibacter cognatus]|uniref:Uncharacterized protein n=1 Tax=Candidatus Accumulibacter cognatus TaxID=2954383 RepID=A0A080M5Y6_9PROT|nr:MAG: hypothetical protein AW06_002223 [Candidatus Accumulibacter cognatus]